MESTGSISLTTVMALEAIYSRDSSNKIQADVLAEARQACYKARDAFYACLEKESSKKPTEIASVGLLYPVECKKSRADFEKQCRRSWVKHFDRQYCGKKGVQRLLGNDESRRVFWDPSQGAKQILLQMGAPISAESSAILMQKLLIWIISGLSLSLGLP